MEIKEKTKKIKEKAKDIKENVVSKAKKVGKVIVEVTETNPSLIITIGMGIGSAVIGILTGAASAQTDKYEHSKVEDDVTGLNYLAKHPLTNREILELSERKVDGETTGEALENMGLLRNEKKRR